MDDEIMKRLLKILPRGLFLELYHMVEVRAREAHEIIRDRTPLKGKSAKAAEGQIRFRIMEQGFQQICEQHGAAVLEEGVIAGTDLRYFQPFARFGGDGPGVVLALASMPARGELPVKNRSRLAGVFLNYHLTPRLPLDKSDPKPGDVFVTFLTARDPARAGRIEEIAIGIIDTEYKSFVFYETIEIFMARYAPATPEESTDAPAPKVVKLKSKGARKAYKPPEEKNDDKDAQEE